MYGINVPEWVPVVAVVGTVLFATLTIWRVGRNLKMYLSESTGWSRARDKFKDWLVVPGRTELWAAASGVQTCVVRLEKVKDNGEVLDRREFALMGEGHWYDQSTNQRVFGQLTKRLEEARRREISDRIHSIPEPGKSTDLIRVEGTVCTDGRLILSPEGGRLAQINSIQLEPGKTSVRDLIRAENCRRFKKLFADTQFVPSSTSLALPMGRKQIKATLTKEGQKSKKIKLSYKLKDGDRVYLYPAASAVRS